MTPATSPDAPIAVRPLARADRDQFTDLVNTHLAALLPGLSVSTSTLLAQLEREPGEYVVDPWVVERVTLVAEQRTRVVAATHLLRYGTAEPVGPDYRGAAEIKWLVCRPDALEAGRALVQAAVAVLTSGRPRRLYANGDLPAPGSYGIPDVWPHVQTLLSEAGFAGGRREEIWLAPLVDLPGDVPPPYAGLRLARTVGVCGTRFSAYEGERRLGYLEVEILGERGRFAVGTQFGDIGNLGVERDARRRGIARWLLATAAAWLRPAGVGQLLTYLDDESPADERGFTQAMGFRRVVTTVSGQTRATPG